MSTTATTDDLLLPNEGCTCCCDFNFDTACLTITLPEEALFDQAAAPLVYLTTTPALPWYAGQTFTGPSFGEKLGLPGALYLTGNYYNPLTGTTLCYSFMVEISFRFDPDCKVVLQVLSPKTIPTVFAENQPSQPFFKCCNYSEFVPVGWLAQVLGLVFQFTDNDEKPDDGSCYFYGHGTINLAAATLGVFWTDAFTNGHCSAPCVNASGCTILPTYPARDIEESDPVDIAPSMDFEVTLPAEWFDIPLEGFTPLGSLVLTVNLTLDPESCAGAEIRFDPPHPGYDKCWVDLNGPSSCRCCITADHCGDDHLFAGFGEFNNGVSFTTEDIEPTGACGGCTGVGITALAVCLNRAWTLPYVIGDECSYDHSFTCSGDSSLAETCNTYRFESRATFNVSFPTNGSSDLVVMTLMLYVKEFACSGGDAVVICEASAVYTYSVALASLSCTGPWTLELGTTAGCDLTWPDEIVVSRANTDGLPTQSTNCCFPTAPGNTWDCTGPPLFDCVEHVGAGGDYATLPLCNDGCIAPITYDCLPTFGCSDPGDGSGFYTGPDALTNCQTNCVPEGGPGDGTCCPDDPDVEDEPTTLPTTISGALFTNQSTCINKAFSMTYSPGLGAWIAGFQVDGCPGSWFVTVYLYCINGRYFLRVICEDDTIIDGEVFLSDNEGFGPTVCYPDWHIEGFANADPSPCMPISTTFGFIFGPADDPGGGA